MLVNLKKTGQNKTTQLHVLSFYLQFPLEAPIITIESL